MGFGMPDIKMSEPNKIRDLFCSNPMVGVGVAISVAIAVIGTLAVVGMFLPPTNPLGVMAGVFGPVGAGVTLLFGLTLFVAALIARFGCFKKESSAQEQTKRFLETIREDGFDTPCFGSSSFGESMLGGLGLHSANSQFSFDSQ